MHRADGAVLKIQIPRKPSGQPCTDADIRLNRLAGVAQQYIRHDVDGLETEIRAPRHTACRGRRRIDLAIESGQVRLQSDEPAGERRKNPNFQPASQPALHVGIRERILLQPHRTIQGPASLQIDADIELGFLSVLFGLGRCCRSLGCAGSRFRCRRNGMMCLEQRTA